MSEAIPAGSGTGAGAATGGAPTSGAPGGAGQAPQATPTSGDWSTGLSDDLKGYASNKGWKDAGSLVESYRNLERTVGVPADQLLRLPKPDDAAGWEGVWNRLGRPTNAADYQLPVPEGGDPEFSKEVAGWFHAAGVPKAAAQKIAGSWNDKVLSLAKAESEGSVAKVEAEKAALKTKWGAAFDQNTALAKKTAGDFGLKAEVIDAIEKVAGYGGVMDFLASVGARFGEDAFVAPNSTPGSGFSGALTPGQAKAAIDAKMHDRDFMQRFRNGDAQARSEWDKLNQFAYPSA